MESLKNCCLNSEDWHKTAPFRVYKVTLGLYFVACWIWDILGYVLWDEGDGYKFPDFFSNWTETACTAWAVLNAIAAVKEHDFLLIESMQKNF